MKNLIKRLFGKKPQPVPIPIEDKNPPRPEGPKNYWQEERHWV